MRIEDVKMGQEVSVEFIGVVTQFYEDEQTVDIAYPGGEVLTFPVRYVELLEEPREELHPRPEQVHPMIEAED